MPLLLIRPSFHLVLQETQQSGITPQYTRLLQRWTVSVREEDVIQRSAGLRIPRRRTGTLPISEKRRSRITTSEHSCKGPVQNRPRGPPDSDWSDRCAVISRSALLLDISICQEVRFRRNRAQSFTMLPARHWLENFLFLRNIQFIAHYV